MYWIRDYRYIKLNNSEFTVPYSGEMTLHKSGERPEQDLSLERKISKIAGKFEVRFPPFLIRSDDDYLISVCREPVGLVRQHPLHPRGPIGACYVV